jgi:hypothetical protein
MASVEYSIDISIDGVLAEIHSAAVALLACGREQLEAWASSYLDGKDLSNLDLSDLALQTATQALLAGELDELCEKACDAHAALTPEQAAEVDRELAAANREACHA